MKIKNLIVLVQLLLLFSNCRKEAKVKIPETEPKPVLVCFISPEDSLIRVTLTNSIPLYTSNSNKFPYEINNATITISDGSTSKIIPWYKDSIGYQLSTKFFPILAGIKYSLNADIPDGRKLKASTQVPINSFPNFEYTYSKNTIDSNEFGVSYEINYKLSWNDFAGETNFYRGIIYNLYSDSTVSKDSIAQLVNEVFESDKDRDGSTIKLAGTSSFYIDKMAPIPMNSSSNIAYLILCNKEYFEYHKDLYTNNDVNPFSESKINFSNIEGGIGCFSAYRVSKKRF
jgi:hypothetical protein